VGIVTAKSKIRSLKSKYLARRTILGLELLFAIVSIVYITFLAYTAGDSVSKLLFLPVSAMLLVPFLSTLVYYRGFEKTALGAILSLVLLPVVIIGGSAALYLPSRAGGLAVLLAVFYSVIAAAVVPYIFFAAVLTVHYCREYFQEEGSK
jgi:hypothetical protein